MALPLYERIGFAVIIGLVVVGIMVPFGFFVGWPVGVIMIIIAAWMMYSIIMDSDKKKKKDNK